MEQYIPKSVLVAEIEKKIKQYEDAFNNPSFASYEACLIAKGKYRKLLDILQFIKNLEAKEVDLDNELDFVKDAYYYFTSDERSSMKKVARHFFELGLKTNKEE